MNAETEQIAEPAAPLENGLRALRNAVIDAVLIVDENEAITAVNAAAEALLGSPSNAVLGASLASVLPPLAAYLPIDALCARGRAGVLIEAAEGEGARRPTHVAVEKVSAASGVSYVIVVRDCRHLEGALQRVLRDQRLAAVDSAMSALTHDMRNLLQHMQSCLTLISLRGNDEVRALAEDLQQAQDRLQRLFEDARSLAAPIRLERRLADVRKIVERAWRALRLRWSKKALTLAIDDAAVSADARAFVDPRLLGQALREVFERAIEAAPENGTVACVLRGGGGEQLEVAVAHAGVDAAAELQAEPFQRVVGGNGAQPALAMVQRLVEEHDGHLRLEERSAGGPHLVIVLPPASRVR